MQNDPSVSLIHSIIGSLSNGTETPNTDWNLMTIIMETFEGAFNSFHGYLYSPDGSITPVAADPSAVMPVFEEYLKDKYKPDEARPVAALLQFDRTTGRYAITLEDNNEERWKVTPKNFREIREELRPALD